MYPLVCALKIGLLFHALKPGGYVTAHDSRRYLSFTLSACWQRVEAHQFLGSIFAGHGGVLSFRHFVMTPQHYSNQFPFDEIRKEFDEARVRPLRCRPHYFFMLFTVVLRYVPCITFYVHNA